MKDVRFAFPLEALFAVRAALPFPVGVAEG